MKKSSAIPIVTQLGKLQIQEQIQKPILTIRLAKGSYPSLSRLAFDPTGRSIICLDCQDNLINIDCKYKKYIQMAKAKPVTAWAIFADNQGVRATVILGHGDGQIQIFKRKGHNWIVMSLNITSNEVVSISQNIHRNLYMFTDSGKLVLVDRTSLKIKASLPCQSDKYLSAIFSPDNQAIITVSRKGMLAVRNISKFQLIDYIHLGYRPNRKAILSMIKDCQWIVLWDKTERIVLYNMIDRSVIKCSDQGRLLHVQITEQGSILYQKENNSILQWTPNQQYAFKLLEDEQGIEQFTYNGQMKALSTGQGLGYIKLYSLQLLRKQATKVQPLQIV